MWSGIRAPLLGVKNNVISFNKMKDIKKGIDERKVCNARG